MPKLININEGIQASIAKAACFMHENQRPSGGFRTYLVPHPSTGVPPIDDSSPFPAALIAHCLGFVQLPQAKEMISKAISFLQSQMSPPGVWRYFADDHPRHLDSPFDLDDTATVSSVLRDNGLSLAMNKQLLLANRNKQGLFYTWLVPRLSLFLKPASLIFALQESLDQKRLSQFFAVNESSPDDIDSVVNANMLYMLGQCPESQPIVSFLKKIILENLEESSDKWHLSKFNFYYFLSKSVFAGFNDFNSVKDLVVQRIESAANIDGSIGANHLETALALCTFSNLGYSSELIEPAIKSILANQLVTGAWEIAPLYYGGPSKGCSFGSEELSTAFCLEALARFNSMKSETP